MQKTFSKREVLAVFLAALVAVFLVPCLNAFVPETSAFHVSDFSINLWGKYFCYAILAITVDLLWGYTGLLSLGQCLFFSLGGYMMGMYLMRMIGSLGQYHMPIPDFLVFLGWTRLPPFWKPFASFPFALMMVALVPGLLAFVFGFLAFRSRIRGVYFSILTQALTYAACLLFFRNNILMGGNNGFTDFKFILGHDLRTASTQRGLYILQRPLSAGRLRRLQVAHRHQARQGPARHPRQREPRPLLRLCRGEFQALHLRARLRGRRSCRRALRPAGRDHQSQ